MEEKIISIDEYIKEYAIPYKPFLQVGEVLEPFQDESGKLMLKVKKIEQTQEQKDLIKKLSQHSLCPEISIIKCSNCGNTKTLDYNSTSEEFFYCHICKGQTEFYKIYQKGKQ